MPAKIPTWDKRMLLLMRHCIDTNQAENQKDFLEAIGFNPTNLRDVKLGTRSFTMEQMVTAARRYKISMNWIVGLDEQMRMPGKSKTALQSLKDAVRSVEAMIK